MPGAFPFRFYGRSPGDWFEVAGGGPAYEVRFERSPAAAEWERLAVAFEEALREGAAEPATTFDHDHRLVLEPWLVSGPVALLPLGERGTHTPAFMADAARMLRALHEVVPIADVVFWYAREPGDDDWTGWSEAERAQPLPGPAYPDLRNPGCYRRPVDDDLPAPAPIDALEAARRHARAGWRSERLAALGSAGREAAARGEIAWIPADRDLHDAAPLPDDGAALADARPRLSGCIGARDKLALGPGGEIVAVGNAVKAFRIEPPGRGDPPVEIASHRLVAGRISAITVLTAFERRVVVAQTRTRQRTVLGAFGWVGGALVPLQAPIEGGVTLSRSADDRVFGLAEQAAFELVNLQARLRAVEAAPPKAGAKKASKAAVPRVTFAWVGRQGLPARVAGAATAEQAARFPEAQRVRVGDDGRLVAAAPPPGAGRAAGIRAVSWTTTAGEVRSVVLDRPSVSSAAFAPGGGRIWVATGDELWALDPASGEARSIYRAPAEARGLLDVAPLADGRVLVLGSEQLLLLAPEGDGLALTDQQAVKQARSVAAMGNGRAALVCSAGPVGVSAYGIGSRKLKRLATSKEKVEDVWCSHDRAFGATIHSLDLEAQHLAAAAAALR